MRPEDPLARFYKSRNLENPAVFVQMEGQWRGYAPNGALQKSSGALPATILSLTVEITREEAESLVIAWQARARAVQQECAAAKPAPPPTVSAPLAAGPAQGDVPAPAAPLAASAAGLSPWRRSRRPLYLSLAAAVVLVALVVGALGLTGHLGLGADGSETSNGSATTESAPDEVLATVGGQEISRRQFDQKIADFAAQYAGQIPDKTAASDQYRQFEEGVLDYLITYQLVSRKATALGITVTDQDVESEMALILHSTYGGDQIKFDAAVKEQGLTLERFELIYGESLLFNKVYAEVTKGVTVTGDDREALEAKQKQFWTDWVDQQMKAAGVSYARGWAAPTDVTASGDPSGR
jgi:hypothetical protein